MDLLFILPGLYLNILKTEKMLQFGEQKILDVRGASFQRKRLNIVEYMMIVNFYAFKRNLILICPLC